VPLPTLSRRTKLLYGFGSVAFGIKDHGFAYLLLLYYNQVLGLPEDWVGLGILVALVLDAFIDPIVGYASDNLHSRWGRRHPFMYAAAVPVAVSYFLLWTPPAGLSPTALFTYLIVLAILVRTFISFYEIPSASLVSELTDHYDQRTSILSYRYFFGWWGGLTMGVLAFALFLQPDATHAVGVLNAAGYRHYALAASIVMAGAILISALGTHAAIPHLRRPPDRRGHDVRRALRDFRDTLGNRSFLVLFGAAIFSSMGTGLTAALNVYFATYFWELTSSQISLLVLMGFPAAVLAFMLAAPLSQHLGKKRAGILTSLGALTLSPLPIALRLAGVFPANGSPILVPALLANNLALITLFITSSILTSSMLADVVEESELTTGRRSEGLLFAAHSLVQKAVSGVGIFASTLLLTAVHFPRGAKPGAVDSSVIRALGLTYVPVMLGIYLVSIAFLFAYRISRTSHEANLRRLAERGAEG
jgi:glycoside/pentoside/hexuronide:cation symporter, GPH family